MAASPPPNSDSPLEKVAHHVTRLSVYNSCACCWGFFVACNFCVALAMGMGLFEQSEPGEFDWIVADTTASENADALSAATAATVQVSASQAVRSIHVSVSRSRAALPAVAPSHVPRFRTPAVRYRSLCV
jgi:hypothetical protein